MKKSQTYKIIIISPIIILSFLLITFFLMFNSEISYSVKNIEGMWIIIIFILIRIFITFGMSLFAINQAFKLKEQNFSIFPLLFALFFLGLTFGKALYLIYLLIYFPTDEITRLILLKIRYIVLLLTMAPLILLSINIIYNNSSHYKKTEEIKNKKKIFLTLMMIIMSVESLIILLASNTMLVDIILICFYIPALIWIFLTYLYYYKIKEDPGKGVLIISLIFGIDLILYIISTISRPLRQTTIGYSPIYLIFGETVDLILIFIIFIGFYIECNYKKV